MKKLIAYAVLLMVVVGYGCMGPMSEEMTPASIDKDAVVVVEKAGTGSAEDYKGFLFPSLASARKLQKDLQEAIVVTDQELKHLVESKQLQDKILTGSVLNNVQVAEVREDALFNPQGGAIALGLGLLGIPAAGYLGMLRKRKGDITPEDHEAALAGIKGEVTEKDRAVLQLVAQMQKVIDAKPQAEREQYLKELKAEQLPETRAAIKAAKARL